MAEHGTRVCIARVGAPHGVRGAVRLQAFTADPADVTAYGPLETEDGRRVEIESLKPAKNALVAQFAGVGDRDAAEALKNQRLYVARDRLPAPDEEEWYHADLLGLAVRDPGGATVGEVVAVQDFGGGELLEIRWEGRRQTVYVPFTRAAVPSVDVAAGFLVVDPPAGLLEDGQGGAGGDAPEDAA